LGRRAVFVLSAFGNRGVDTQAQVRIADARAALRVGRAERHARAGRGLVRIEHGTDGVSARATIILGAGITATQAEVAVREGQTQIVGIRARSALAALGAAVAARHSAEPGKGICVGAQAGEAVAAVLAALAGTADHGLDGRLRRASTGRGLDAQAVTRIADAVAAVSAQGAVSPTKTACLKGIAGELLALGAVASSERPRRALLHAMSVGVGSSDAHRARRTAARAGGGAVASREASAEPEGVGIGRQADPSGAVCVPGALLADRYAGAGRVGIGRQSYRHDAGAEVTALIGGKADRAGLVTVERGLTQLEAEAAVPHGLSRHLREDAGGAGLRVAGIEAATGSAEATEGRADALESVTERQAHAAGTRLWTVARAAQRSASRRRIAAQATREITEQAGAALRVALAGGHTQTRLRAISRRLLSSRGDRDAHHVRTVQALGRTGLGSARLTAARADVLPGETDALRARIDRLARGVAGAGGAAVAAGGATAGELTAAGGDATEALAAVCIAAAGGAHDARRDTEAARTAAAKSRARAAARRDGQTADQRLARHDAPHAIAGIGVRGDGTQRPQRRASARPQRAAVSGADLVPGARRPTAAHALERLSGDAMIDGRLTCLRGCGVRRTRERRHVMVAAVDHRAGEREPQRHESAPSKPGVRGVPAEILHGSPTPPHSPRVARQQ